MGHLCHLWGDRWTSTVLTKAQPLMARSDESGACSQFPDRLVRKTSPTAVPTLYLGPQTRAETALLLELDPRLAGNCPFEGRPRKQFELDEDLPQSLTVVTLSPQCELKLVVPHGALLQEQGSEQGSFAADVVHVPLSPF